MLEFTKTRPGAPPVYFQREAEGLRWLAEANGANVVRVLEVGVDHLTLQRVTPGHASAPAALDFGRALATTHMSGAAAYGAAPPSSAPTDVGFIADAPLPFGYWEGFGAFYAQARLMPYLERLPTLARSSTFTRLLAALLAEDERLIGPAESPSRIHGDLWSGNVLWSGHDGQAWLIDPAAHGGHRETDLAMLALFGVAHLSDILMGYQQVHPLSAGWRARVPLHQVHPLLVHALLFGGSYVNQAESAAQAALASTL